MRVHFNKGELVEKKELNASKTRAFLKRCLQKGQLGIVFSISKSIMKKQKALQK